MTGRKTTGAALLLAACTFLAPVRARAAEPEAPSEPGPTTEHTLDISLGYADYGVADEAATALVYRGAAGAGRLFYFGERPHLRWTAGLGFAMGPYFAANYPDREARFETVDVHGETDEVRVPMRGRVLVPRASLGLDGKWSFGIVSLLVGGTLDYELFLSQGFVRPGLMQSLSAKPAVRVRVDPTPAHRLELGATTTIAAWVVRMPYHQSVSVPGENAVNGFIQLGSKVQGPATLQSFALDLGYRYRINHRVGLGVRYRFAWQRNEVPRLLTRAEQDVLLGVEIYL